MAPLQGMGVRKSRNPVRRTSSRVVMRDIGRKTSAAGGEGRTALPVSHRRFLPFVKEIVRRISR
jgi:hypothetical protein